MEPQRYEEKYADILRGGFGPITCAVPAFIELPGDMLVIMAWNPEAPEPSGVALLNKKLLDDEAFQERFKNRLYALCSQIVVEMEAADIDLITLAIACFCASVDMGYINPCQAPLTKALRLSSLRGWKGQMIAAYVYREHVDGQRLEQVGVCGSQQPSGKDG